ncbi:TPA: hypothetical protein DCX15_02850 [bacterium]|nr:hypothetical protein [bacterium]
MDIKMIDGKIIQPELEIPIIEDVDTLIIGGGVAGVAAAISSAREGASNLLIERYGFLGGMVTGGLVLRLEGFGDGEKMVVKGIAEEIVERLDAMGGAKRLGYDITVDPELLKILLFRMVEEAGVKLLLHSLVVETLVEDKRVKGVIIENKSGRGALLGKVVIDASGDGDVFARASAEFATGQRGFGIIFRLSGVDHSEVERFRTEKQDEYNTVIEEVKGLLGFPILGSGEIARGFVWWSNMTSPKDGLDIFELSQQEVLIRENILRAVKLAKEKIPGFGQAQFVQTASQFGVRETRRLIGRFILTEENIKKGSRFEDAIAHAGYGGTPGVGYDIPYGCLVPKEIDGLIVAGRCISSDEFSQNFLRVVANCLATGQGAGTAAALSLKDGVTPRDVNITKLKTQLKQQGVYLLGS